MPRDIDLYISFPSRISPDVAAAHTRHLACPCSFGLLATEEASKPARSDLNGHKKPFPSSAIDRPESHLE